MNINKLYNIGLLLIPAHAIGFILAFMYIGGATAIIGTTIAIMISIIVYRISRKSLRIKYINEYEFPPIVMKKFMGEYKLLKDTEVDLVKNGLKQFFMIYAIAVSEGRTPRKGFMMPSKIVDELWHNFMLDSRNYEEFCDLAFGKMLHHKPGENTTGNKKLDKLTKYPEELKNTYKHIHDLKYHTQVALLGGIPLLFALDQHFNVDNGFYYNDTVMNNILLSLDKPSATSSDSGSCGGLLATDTGSCSSSDGGGSDGGGCGGGCGD